MTQDTAFLNHARRTLTTPSPCGKGSLDAHEREVNQAILDRMTSPRLATSNDESTFQVTPYGAETSHEPQACFLNSMDAKVLIDSRDPISRPIFVSDAQTHRWSVKSLPLSQVWDFFPDMNIKLGIEKGSDPHDNTDYARHSLHQIRNRFTVNHASNELWKIVDVPSPLPEGMLPVFLNGPNASLLRSVRYRALMVQDDNSSPLVDSSLLTDTDQWLELAEAGTMTLPHQDDCGLASWTTCQQGEIGVVWLDRPTSLQLLNWMKDPNTPDSGLRWCYKVLHQYQTVYLPPGTVHFNFRLPGTGRQTFAISGQVLRKADLDVWTSTLLEQMSVVPQNCGEDAPRFPFHADVNDTVSLALLLLHHVRKMVQSAAADGRHKSFRDSPMVGRFHQNFEELGKLFMENLKVFGLKKSQLKKQFPGGGRYRQDLRPGEQPDARKRASGSHARPSPDSRLSQSQNVMNLPGPRAARKVSNTQRKRSDAVNPHTATEILVDDHSDMHTSNSDRPNELMKPDPKAISHLERAGKLSEADRSNAFYWHYQREGAQERATNRLSAGAGGEIVNGDGEAEDGMDIWEDDAAGDMEESEEQDEHEWMLDQ